MKRSLRVGGTITPHWISRLQNHLGRQQQNAQNHPPAEDLQAFAEGRQRGAERRTILSHLAICEMCRETIALIAEPEARERKTVGWGWRILALAATGSLAVVLIWLPLRTPAELPPPKIIALSRPPAPTITSEPQTPPPATPVHVAAKKRVLRVRSAEPPQPAPEAIAQMQAVLAAPPQVASAPMANTAPVSARAYSFGFASGVVQVNPRSRILWTLFPNQVGALRRSNDGGRSWQIIPVEAGVRPLALAASDDDVWVGGGEGKLLHSVDGGTRWVTISVSDPQMSLHEPIVSINAHKGQVTVKTVSGLAWFSMDGGLHWQHPE